MKLVVATDAFASVLEPPLLQLTSPICFSAMEASFFWPNAVSRTFHRNETSSLWLSSFCSTCSTNARRLNKCDIIGKFLRIVVITCTCTCTFSCYGRYYNIVTRRNRLSLDGCMVIVPVQILIPGLFLYDYFASQGRNCGMAKKKKEEILRPNVPDLSLVRSISERKSGSWSMLLGRTTQYCIPHRA